MPRRSQRVTIRRGLTEHTAVHQFVKLRMFKFYYDFLDKYVDRREYMYMDTNSAYFAIFGVELRDVEHRDFLKEYKKDVKN